MGNRYYVNRLFKPLGAFNAGVSGPGIVPHAPCKTTEDAEWLAGWLNVAYAQGLRAGREKSKAVEGDLLDACKSILSQHDVYQQPLIQSVREKLERAIAKAEEV